jgi:hypothetical protein
MFVWLSYSQTLVAVIAGCQAAWGFFGGVFAVLIPDNLKPVFAAADAINPRFTQGWLDYAGHVGLLTDPARVPVPQGQAASGTGGAVCAPKLLDSITRHGGPIPLAIRWSHHPGKRQ